MTESVPVDPDHPEAAAIARAAECLRRGGLVAFPTETVYGLGVHALNREAVRRLFEAKGRPANDPVIVHVASPEGMHSLARHVPDEARALAARFWPGPLTIVLPRLPVVPDEVTAGLETVAIRVPAHPVARALIVAAGIPVAAPSANLFSRPSPTRASHVLDDLDGRIDMVIDGGSATVGVESTVVDVSRETPVVLRPGAITVEMLREVLPAIDVLTLEQHQGAAASPGLLPKHYSPRARLTLYEGEPREAVRRLVRDARACLVAGDSVGVIVADEDQDSVQSIGRPANVRLEIRSLASERDVTRIAARLYDVIRELDATGVDQILVRGFPAEGLGQAIADRLRRAAAGRIVG